MNETAAKTEKVKPNYIEPKCKVEEYDVVSYISQDCEPNTKKGVVGPVYADDGKVEWSMMFERWGLTELQFAQLAVNTLITRVNFKGADGNQDEFQKRVDAYKAGQRVSAGPKDNALKEVKAAAKAMNMSIADVIALIKAKKSA